MTALLLSAALLAAVPSKTVWMNEDNQHFYDGKYHGDEDMTAEGCRRLVDTYYASGALGGMLFCVNMQMALYDSDVWERFKDQKTDYSYQAHLRLLSDRKVDQFKEWLGRCRELGVPGWLSMRMNDCHALEFVAFNLPLPAHQTVTLWPSQLWRSHPEWRRAPYRIEHGWEGAFNYSVPEVYAHHLKLVKEIFSRWDMDGLELDWMRWAMHFPPGGELEGRSTLTRFVKDVRALADEAERRLGHRVRLGCRVPADPESCLRFGYDVAAWSDAGCVDMVTLAGFGNETPNDIPIELWRRLLKPGTKINCGLSYGGAGCAAHNSVSSEEIRRGAAASAWACGADGVYLFNECYREPARTGELLAYMRDISSMAALNATSRRSPVTDRCAMPGYSAHRVLPEPLALRYGGQRLERLDPHITLRITTGEVPSDADCELSVAFSEGTSDKSLAALEVRLNTVRLERRRRVDLPAGRIDPKKVWVKCTDYPRDARTVLVYTVPARALHARENAIEIIPPADADGAVVWADIRVAAASQSTAVR